MAIKRYLIAAAAAATVFTGVYGAASQLAINNNPNLQVGSTNVSCDLPDDAGTAPAPFGVSVSFVHQTPGNPFTPVVGVTVGNIDQSIGSDPCWMGKDLTVQLRSQSGAQLAIGTFAPITGTSHTVPITPGIASAAIFDVDVAIHD
ncbi:MAG: hypothetical protein ACT4QG_15995 [Sporichthyaceae bacterium]